MPKIIRRLRGINSRSVLLPAIITLLILTSVAFADEIQFLFDFEELKDPGSLVVKLQDTRAVISQYIAAQLSTETQQLLGKYDGISRPSPDLQNALLTDLNQLLKAGPLYDAESFADIKLSKQTQKLLAQNPQNGEALVRLNRFLLTDAYPYELALLVEKQDLKHAKEIETCRKNLREIKLALENYRAAADAELQWLSELSPQYLEKKLLLCPADPTAGVPGVLTEGAADPTLPCSYLYEIRSSEKMGQKFLLEMEGDMLPIVRCQHHFLNLSVSGKLYRNGPQRNIYDNSTMKIVGKVSMQTQPSGDLPPQVRKQMEAELLKGGNKGESSIFQINPSDNLQAQLREQFGEAFLESPDGKALLKQLTSASSTSTNPEELAHLLGKPMPDIALSNLSGKLIKLETFRGKFILLSIFSLNSDRCGLKLQHLEKLLKNYDVSQLQAVGISTSGSKKEIEAFKEKYQLSMLVWMGKNDQVQTRLNRDTSKTQGELVILLLNRELVVKDVFIDFDPESLSQKVKQLIESKE